MKQSSLLLAGVLVIVAAALYVVMQNLGDTRLISVGDTTVVVDVVSTDLLRQKGLSGRESLADGTGMLFVFDTSDRWGIWMKDMRFAIDILWIREDGVVVTLKEHVAPESAPTVFSSTEPARYVLELPAGFARKHGVGEGSVIQL